MFSINADARTNFSCTIAAIATVVTIAEILKNNGLAVEKSETSIFLLPPFRKETIKLLNLLILWNVNAEIMTSTVDIKDDSRGRPVQKAKVCQYDI